MYQLFKTLSLFAKFAPFVLVKLLQSTILSHPGMGAQDEHKYCLKFFLQYTEIQLSSSTLQPLPLWEMMRVGFECPLSPRPGKCIQFQQQSKQSKQIMTEMHSSARREHDSFWVT